MVLDLPPPSPDRWVHFRIASSREAGCCTPPRRCRSAEAFCGLLPALSALLLDFLSMCCACPSCLRLCPSPCPARRCRSAPRCSCSSSRTSSTKHPSQMPPSRQLARLRCSPSPRGRLAASLASSPSATTSSSSNSGLRQLAASLGSQPTSPLQGQPPPHLPHRLTSSCHRPASWTAQSRSPLSWPHLSPHTKPTRTAQDLGSSSSNNRPSGRPSPTTCSVPGQAAQHQIRSHCLQARSQACSPSPRSPLGNLWVVT